jgi:DNA-binding protein H-NS
VSAQAGDYAVDGERVTASDVARLQASELEQLDRTAPAVWTLAAAAADAEECRELLDMLGLTAAAVTHARRLRPSRSDRLIAARVTADRRGDHRGATWTGAGAQQFQAV